LSSTLKQKDTTEVRCEHLPENDCHSKHGQEEEYHQNENMRWRPTSSRKYSLFCPTDTIDYNTEVNTESMIVENTKSYKPSTEKYKISSAKYSIATVTTDIV
jgi:hypothetical protein